ncbi:MAG: phage integrase SAM-like domain-containing protein [Bacteroidales bacterium]
MISKIEDYELSIVNERGEFNLVNDLKDFSLEGQSSQNNIISWLQDQIEADNTVTPGTTGYRKTMLNKFIDAVGYDLKASQVNHEAITRFDNYMAKQNLTSSSRSKLHNQLRKFLTIARHQVELPR